MPSHPRLQARLRNIRALLLDVDGVMTDGGVYYSDSGEELKKFNIQDGYGIVKLRKAGFRIGIITGRASKIVERRAAELGIEDVLQNLDDKAGAYESLRAKFGLPDEAFAYIGDDEFDLPVLTRVGFSAAPANAVPKVLKMVDYVCRKSGGAGAVREVVELLLEKKAPVRRTRR